MLPLYNSQTPRYYTVTDTTSGPRRAEQNYSYSYSSTSERSSNSNDPYSRPQSYSSTVERKTRAGPSGDYYNTESRTTTGGGPGGYSYSSTSSGRLPHGTSYRHYSYRV